MLGSGKIETKLLWEGKRTDVDRVVMPFQVIEVSKKGRVIEEGKIVKKAH